MKSEDVEKICELNLEYLYLGALISSDNILTIQDAEEGLKKIEDTEKAVDESSLSAKKKMELKGFLERGRNILNGDIERFKKLT